ncbi:MULTISPECIES: phosphotransferase [Streptomyces]|uniref:phosphotransferase n=1 Tax=Streptomyces TaxID=1883 RepID=UPI00167A38D1|nr:phosphotransferase [Streptomyces canarius]
MAALPVLRPVLMRQEGWSCGDWVYQVELTSRIPVQSFSPNRAAPEWVADLPAAWWAGLRAALDGIQRLASAGLASAHWLEAAVRSVGAVDAAPWAPSHGDVCWANLAAVGDRAVLFDWEDFGRAPRFTDVAVLLLSSLDTPDVAARVRAHFSDQLDSPDGLYAQVVVAAHWARRFKAGEHVDLAPALRAHMRMVEERASRTGTQGGATGRCAPC